MDSGHIPNAIFGIKDVQIGRLFFKNRSDSKPPVALAKVFFNP